MAAICYSPGLRSLPQTPGPTRLPSSATYPSLQRASLYLTPAPSPQEWISRRASQPVPAIFDPPGSPLDLLMPISEPLDDEEWAKRYSLLRHRHRIKQVELHEEDVIEKAFQTLDMFCVGEDVKKSLKVRTEKTEEEDSKSHARTSKSDSGVITFKQTCTHNRPSTAPATSFNTLRSQQTCSWLEITPALNDPFDLSDSVLYTVLRRHNMDVLTDITVASGNMPTTPQLRRFNKRKAIRSSFRIHDENSPNNMSSSPGPHFMSSTSSSASRNQVAVAQAYSRPSTPLSVESSAAKSESWMKKTGKRFGINSSNSRMDNSPLNKALSYKSISSTFASRQVQKKTEGSLNTPVLPRPDTPSAVLPTRDTPPDKPLPSLPVATVKTRSPVNRRSLIDAVEQPLKRNMSPSPGILTQEDWPALSPMRRGSLSNSLKEAVDAAESMSFSDTMASPLDSDLSRLRPDVYMKSLASSAGQKRNSSTATQVLREETGARNSSILNDHKMPRLTELTDRESTPEGFAKVPSLETSFQSMHISNGSVRQTRTTSIRARLSADNKDLPARKHNDNTRTTRSQPMNRRKDPEDCISLIPRPSTNLGPVRSSKPSVNGRGSPYDQTSRVKSKFGFSPTGSAQTEIPIERSVSAQSATPPRSSSMVIVKEGRPSRRKARSSSIALPRRVIQKVPEGDSEAEVLLHKPKENTYLSETFKDHVSDHGDVDTDDATRRAESLSAISGTTADQIYLLTAGGTDCCPEKDKAIESPGIFDEDADVRLESDEESDVASLQDFDSQNQSRFRTKRLSHVAPRHGPVLRISDAADRIIMGTGEVEDDSDATDDAHGQSSISDLRHSALKRSFRRSIQGLPLTRSMTNRSLIACDADGMKEDSEKVEDVKDGNSEIRNEPENPAEKHVSETTEHETWIESAADDLLPDERSNWPFKKGDDSPKVSRTSNEQLEQDEDAWIPPLGKTPENFQNEPTSFVSQAPFQVPNNTPASIDDSSPLRIPTFRRVLDEDTPLNRRRSALHRLADDPPASKINSMYPIRNSSRKQVKEIAASYDEKANHNASRISEGQTNHQRGTSANSNRLYGQSTVASRRHERINSETIRNLDKELQEAKRFNTPDPVTLPSSTTKGLLSNVRGLFHKRSTDIRLSASKLPASKRTKTLGTPGKISPLVPRTPISAKRNSLLDPGRIISPTDSMFATSASGSSETAEATRVAMRILDMAKEETNVRTKKNLMELGKAMVQAITTSHDAEKAMEEAKQAAGRAEIHAMNTKKAVTECTDIIGTLMLGE